MSFLKGMIGGIAKGGSSVLDGMQDEEDAQRKRVDDNIFSTTNTMFKNAVVVRDNRQKEIKANTAYSNLLFSKDATLSQSQMAYVLSLPEKARQDILNLADSETFRKNDIPLADYFEAIDDPIEYADPVTLTEQVLGKTIERPLEASDYYGVSTTEDKEVDKIVAGYAGGFATAYGMSAAHAQGLLDSATQDVKMQRFKINWAHKKFVSSQNDAHLISQVAAAKLNVHKVTMSIGKAMEKNADISINEDRLLWGSKQATPYGKKEFDALPELTVKYKKSKHYQVARHETIMIAGQNMVDAGGVLDKATESFLNATFPGFWGGEVDGPIENLTPHKYYIAKGKDGLVGVYQGSALQQHIAHLQSKRGFDPSVQVEPSAVPKVGTTISNSGLESDIAKQEKRVLDSTKLGETDSTVKREEEFTEKLKQVKVTEDYFTNLDTAPKPADAAKMTDAVRNILDRGDVTEIEAAFNKISGWSSSMGQPFTVSTAITNAISSLGEAIQAKDVGESSSEVTTFLSTSLDGISKSAVEAAIRKINKYPKHIKNRDDVKTFKEKLYLTLDGM